MKIAIDFDGTCVDHRFPDVGQEVPGAVDTLTALAFNGHKLFLYTMRSGRYLAAAVEWFNERGIRLSGIQCDPAQSQWTQSPKCYAEVYVDDAALGAPLVQPEGFERPCVDWEAVQEWFISNARTNASDVMEAGNA